MGNGKGKKLVSFKTLNYDIHNGMHSNESEKRGIWKYRQKERERKIKILMEWVPQKSKATIWNTCQI